MEDFYDIFCVNILSGFFPLVFGISLAIVKIDVKNVVLISLFLQNQPAILSFFDLCHLPDKCWMNFVFKTETCRFCCEFLTDLCYVQKLHADAFAIPLNFFKARRHQCLCVITANTRISPNQKQYELTFSQIFLEGIEPEQ